MGFQSYCITLQEGLGLDIMCTGNGYIIVYKLIHNQDDIVHKIFSLTQMRDSIRIL